MNTIYSSKLGLHNNIDLLTGELRAVRRLLLAGLTILGLLALFVFVLMVTPGGSRGQIRVVNETRTLLVPVFQLSGGSNGSSARDQEIVNRFLGEDTREESAITLPENNGANTGEV